VAFSSAKNVEELQELKPALRTLLQGAFRTVLTVPPLSERQAVVRKLAETFQLNGSEELYDFVSRTYCGSVQELVSAVRALGTYASLQGKKKLQLPDALRAFAGMQRSNKKPLTMRQVEEVMQEAFPDCAKALGGKSRSRRDCRVRQIAMYLSRIVVGESLSDIGRRFGGRTHSTVKHAVDKMSREMKADSETAAVIEALRLRLQS
jgi:chromosomal replication initiator protein